LHKRLYCRERDSLVLLAHEDAGQRAPPHHLPDVILAGVQHWGDFGGREQAVRLGGWGLRLLGQFGEQVSGFSEELGEAGQDVGMLPGLCAHVVGIIITSLWPTSPLSVMASLNEVRGLGFVTHLIDASLSENAEGVN
jgi:hypothetical protein